MTREMIQFRPSSDLTAKLITFIKEVQVSRGIAAKHLVYLALHGLDVRFYPLILAMAKSDRENDTFANCCQHLGSALEGANYVHEVDENDRLKIILSAAQRYTWQNDNNITIDSCFFSISKDMDRFLERVKNLAPTCQVQRDF